MAPPIAIHAAFLPRAERAGAGTGGSAGETGLGSGLVPRPACSLAVEPSRIGSGSGWRGSAGVEAWAAVGGANPSFVGSRSRRP
jgi:hypothetical protein